MKRYKVGFTMALAMVLVTISACKKDFLEEELVSSLTLDYYDTEQGIEDLIKAAYEPVRWKFNWDHAYALFNYGVDEYTNAASPGTSHYDSYNTSLNPADVYLHDMWTAYYDGINRCNLGIERVPTVAGIKTMVTTEQKNARIAEVRFLRAFYYFQLVQQFGAIPLVLQSSSGVRLEFPRVAVPEIYKAIFNDLRFAAEFLPATQPDFGRATKGAAQHFLAKAYLTRGSAVTEQRGQQPTDLDSAAHYADLVIANKAVYELLPDYGKLWDISSYANSMAAQRSKEMIFAGQFSSNQLTIGRFGNKLHLYFLMIYQNKPGMVRDVVNGREFTRLRPTDYALDIFDRKNDSRFYKSVKLAYYANSPTASSYPKWEATNPVAASLVNKPKFALGDTSIYLVVNKADKPDSIKFNSLDVDPKKSKYRYLLYPRYYRDVVTGEVKQSFNPDIYPSLSKHLDPFRLSASDEKGTRDGIHARLGETYLIAAEAYGRKGNYGKALEYVNALRARAAYKAGEAKPPQYWLVEGGKTGDIASTYDSIKVTETIFTENMKTEMYPPTATTTTQRFIHFILNERTRELLGELYRWEDLVRTETLIERASLFNASAQSGIRPHHKLRPIPQAHLERVYENGAALTAEQRQAQQNPGY